MYETTSLNTQNQFKTKLTLDIKISLATLLVSTIYWTIYCVTDGRHPRFTFSIGWWIVILSLIIIGSIVLNVFVKKKKEEDFSILLVVHPFIATLSLMMFVWYADVSLTSIIQSGFFLVIFIYQAVAVLQLKMKNNLTFQIIKSIFVILILMSVIGQFSPFKDNLFGLLFIIAPLTNIVFQIIEIVSKKDKYNLVNYYISLLTFLSVFSIYAIFFGNL